MFSQYPEKEEIVNICEELRQRALTYFRKADDQFVRRARHLALFLKKLAENGAMPSDISVNDVFENLRESVDCPEILLACRKLMEAK